MTIFLTLIIVGSAILTWRETRYGLYVALAEIMLGGHGHLIDGVIGPIPVSLRTAIFVGVMFGWGISYLMGRTTIVFKTWRDAPWLVLILAVAIGAINGFLNHAFGVAFDDANGFLTIAYLLPIVSVDWKSIYKHELLKVASWCLGIIVVSTLSLSFLFNHLPGKTLDPLYHFIRDARLAEVTLQVQESGFYYYRVFMPSQLFAAIGLVILASMALIVWRGQRLPISLKAAIIGCAATVLLSMSRSFILGVIAGLVVVGVLALREGSKPIVSVVWRTCVIAVLGALGFGLAYLTIAVPVPTRPDLTQAAFFKTSSEVGRSAGVTSRWSLLTPLMSEIYNHPLLGSGFGESVTYKSDDPRIIAETGGEYTTYRFEWGYQDLWLKMGLLGLVAFVLILYAYTVAAHKTAKAHGHAWLPIGVIGGVIALYVIHIFSPYLNHPIGLGYLLFIIPLLDWQESKLAWIPLTLPTPSLMPKQELVGVAGMVKREPTAR